MSDTYEYPGQLYVDSVVIRSTTNIDYDITSMVGEINIFESVFNSVMSGTITILDTAGLISNVPISGFELLTIRVKTPNLPMKTLVFSVYKISDIKYKTTKAAAYTLQLISPEAITDQTISYSKAYSGKHSDIVKAIYKEAFTGNNKLIELGESESSTKFINPYWNPFQAIQWIANRTFGSGTIPAFMFFETIDGFKFKDFNTAFTSKPKIEYLHRPTNINFGKDNVKEKIRTIIKLNIKETASTLEMVMNGTFGGDIIVKPINYNSYSVKKFTYNASFAKKKKLNEFPIKPVIDAAGRTLEGANSTRFIGTTGNAFGENENNQFERWVLERKSFIEQLMAVNVEATVHGHLGLVCGDVVELTVPKASEANEIDPKVSGRYVITSIRHVINQKVKHLMVLQLSKESFASEAQINTLRNRLVKDETGRIGK